jgi:hypothetical protein
MFIFSFAGSNMRPGFWMMPASLLFEEIIAGGMVGRVDDLKRRWRF